MPHDAVNEYQAWFNQWRDKHNLSFTAAANALGISRRTVAYYASGDKPVPKHIALACKGWEIVHH